MENTVTKSTAIRVEGWSVAEALLLAVAKLPSAWVIRYNFLRLKKPIVEAATQTLTEYDAAPDKETPPW